MITATLYADLNCPYSYALTVRLEALGLMDRCEWRGVQHDPALPTPPRLGDRRLMRALEDDVDAVRRMAPDVAITPPPLKPNTRRAIAAVATVHGQHVPRAAEFRRALGAALWVSGEDISDGAVINSVASWAGVPGWVDLDGPAGRRLADEWDMDWMTLRLGGVPRLVRPDGRVLWGLVSADEITEFFNTPLRQSGEFGSRETTEKQQRDNRETTE
ncbi:MAG: DsbA family protein [Gemmatimonadaceae bacterium]|nr:DsbA family protein [Gemmatimonadaceae bacterium]